jgi:hypothetical protein
MAGDKNVLLEDFSFSNGLHVIVLLDRMCC